MSVVCWEGPSRELQVLSVIDLEKITPLQAIFEQKANAAAGFSGVFRQFQRSAQVTVMYSESLWNLFFRAKLTWRTSWSS